MVKNQGYLGVPVWLSGVRIQHCHRSGRDLIWIPGPGTYICGWGSQKKKKKKEKKKKKKKKKKRKEKKIKDI